MTSKSCSCLQGRVCAQPLDSSHAAGSHECLILVLEALPGSGLELRCRIEESKNGWPHDFIFFLFWLFSSLASWLMYVFVPFVPFMWLLDFLPFVISWRYVAHCCSMLFLQRVKRQLARIKEQQPCYIRRTTSNSRIQRSTWITEGSIAWVSRHGW